MGKQMMKQGHIKSLKDYLKDRAAGDYCILISTTYATFFGRLTKNEYSKSGSRRQRRLRHKYGRLDNYDHQLIKPRWFWKYPTNFCSPNISVKVSVYKFTAQPCLSYQ